jgi:hypothetical protein
MIELISLHIPKTGGRSFRRILKNIYGDALDLRHEIRQFYANPKHAPPIEVDFPENIRAIHAHLSIAQFMPVIEECQPKVVTWIRNPVDRVISNYYFFMKRIRDQNVDGKQLGKKDFSLLDYAAERGKENKLLAFMTGIDLDEFFFIGVLEQMKSDVKELSSKMGWPDKIKTFHANSNYDFKYNNDCKTQYADIDDKMRSEIARLNDLDIKLYNDVLKMRGIK